MARFDSTRHDCFATFVPLIPDSVMAGSYRDHFRKSIGIQRDSLAENELLTAKDSKSMRPYGLLTAVGH
jgi:hypothetical protein